jgi:hypothetical protein
MYPEVARARRALGKGRTRTGTVQAVSLSRSGLVGLDVGVGDAHSSSSIINFLGQGKETPRKALVDTGVASAKGTPTLKSDGKERVVNGSGGAG